LSRALTLVEEVNLADERAIFLTELAELKRLQGHRPEALRQAERALGFFRQQGDLRGATEAQLRIVAVHCDAREWDAAVRSLDALPKGAPANLEQAAAVARFRGEIALGRGDHAAALQPSAAAIAAAGEAHSAPAQLRSRLLRARALVAAGRLGDVERELPQLDRLLQAYPAVELKRIRAQLAGEGKPRADQGRQG
jgi:tetratricopeptide (TPR) repeat protein